MWYTYILLCEDGSFYTGVTNNLQKRFSAHKMGKGGYYTRSHKPIRIVYQERLNSKGQALKRESQIKGWNRESKIRTLLLKTTH